MTPNEGYLHSCCYSNSKPPNPGAFIEAYSSDHGEDAPSNTLIFRLGHFKRVNTIGRRLSSARGSEHPHTTTPGRRRTAHRERAPILHICLRVHANWRFRRGTGRCVSNVLRLARVADGPADGSA